MLDDGVAIVVMLEESASHCLSMSSSMFVVVVGVVVVLDVEAKADVAMAHEQSRGMRAIMERIETLFWKQQNIQVLVLQPICL